ncbi:MULTISPECIES: DUF4097 family beta strand repeat-containing protein [Bacillus]|uniref:DUF4097 domain-containing protein n=2 Tax=Bacillus pseudomycoides TaxID=64104 RepID=A0A1Y3MLS9_9BACI|nr:MULTISPECIES: DUF4097 family beta strand repeat-containing protein [Bacillus cereus group]EOP73168.1 hypothetical protein KOW_00578 [Bacillus cereus VDM006]EOQ09280.1 hypothetical protein KOY_03249 [Bacillus cereus VDM021]MDF2084355.1 hypothetical protein [Bacillus pseudomycoides]OUM49400.1 hypothetical protein BW425_08275 [Bacillus pseudomycoides]
MKKRWIKFCILITLILTGCSNSEGETMEQQLELPTTDVKTLKLDNRNGNIHISTNLKSDKIEASITAKAKGISMDKLKLDLSAKNGIATLNTSFDGQFFSNSETWVDVKLSLPKNIKVEFKKTHRDGDIRVSNLDSDINILNVNGNIDISNVNGTVSVTNRDGNVDIVHTKSDINLDNNNGKVAIKDIKGSIRAKIGDGSADINNIEKNVTILGAKSDKIKVHNVTGKITFNK